MPNRIDGHWRILAGLGFACVVLGAVYYEGYRDLKKFRTLVFIGSASYSIYLMNSPAISVFVRLLSFFSLHWLLAVILCFAAACTAGILYFILIEKPLILFSKKYWMQKST